MKQTSLVMAAIFVGTIFSSQMAFAAPAINMKDQLCAITVEGEEHLIQGKITFTKSKNGNAMLSCHGVIENPPSNTVVTKSSDPNDICMVSMPDENDPENSIMLYSSDWKSVVTPSGEANLSCHFKAP